MQRKIHSKIVRKEGVTEAFAKKVRTTLRLEFGRFAVLKLNKVTYPLEYDLRRREYKLLASSDEGGLFDKNKYGSYSKYVTPDEIEEAFEIRYYADLGHFFAPVLSQSEDGTLTLTYNDEIEVGNLHFKESSRGLYTAQYDPVKGDVDIKRIYKSVDHDLPFRRSTEPEIIDFFRVKSVSAAKVLIKLLSKQEITLNGANEIWAVIENEQEQQSRSSFA